MKEIYLVMAESRVRESGEQFKDPYPVIANDTLEESEKDVERWNKEQEMDKDNYLENRYYIEKINLYEK